MCEGLIQLGCHANGLVRTWRRASLSGVYQGEWYYLSPEQQLSNGQAYGEQAETWALGMLLLEMLRHSKPAFDRRNKQK